MHDKNYCLKKFSPLFFAILVILFLCIFLSCDMSIDSGAPRGEITISVKDKTFIPIDCNDKAIINLELTDLLKNDVYLIKINKSQKVVEANDSGRIISSNSSVPPLPVVQEASNSETHYNHYSPAFEWNANAPLLKDLNRLENSRAVSGLGDISTVPTQGLKDIPLGGSWDFWVELETTGNWQLISADLVYNGGSHCKVWVASDSEFERDDAILIGEKFNDLYEKETNLLGFEYGGGPGGNRGVDGDEKIHILIYNFAESDVVGYFWSKDYYSQDTLNGFSGNVKTNNAEIFYITDRQYDMSVYYSTLAHEFQHMINFNNKTINKEINSSTWYNEMLSMITEDTISPLIGIPITSSGHPIQNRIPQFLYSYNSTGVTEWLGGFNTLKSYSNAYAFGAYLVRNYGGAELLAIMAKNNSVDEESISDAMAALGYSGGFDAALSNYAYALIYTDDSHPSFNKTVTKNIGGIDYTFTNFDISTIPQANVLDPESSGVKIFNFNNYTEPLRPRGITVFQGYQWNDRTGNLKMSLTSPVDKKGVYNPLVELYIIIR